MRFPRLVALGALAVVACSSGEKAGPAGEVGGTVLVLFGAEPSDLLPALVGDQAGRVVSDLLFDRLADLPPSLSTVGDAGYTPRLAKSWKWSSDSLSIAFSLDPAARWHDGKPVRAEDVRFTYKYTVDPKIASQLAPNLANVDSVAVPDSLTAVVYFKKRRPEQFYDFVYQLPVIPEHVYGSVPLEQLKTSESARKPIGTGKFRFVRWDAGSRIELIADTANYRGRPKLDRLIFALVRDAAAGAAQILSGQADFFEACPIDQVAKLDSTKVARATPYSGAGYSFLVMNQFDRKSTSKPHPIFGDIAVRHAIAMSLDRQAMLKNVYGNVGRISYGPFPKISAAADTMLRLPAYDPAHAGALLDSAGWRETTPGGVRSKNGRPLKFGLMVPTSSLFRMRYGVLIQEQLRNVGAEADLEQVEFTSTFRPRQQAGDYDAEIGSFNTDPSVSGSKETWSTQSIGGNGQNFMRYSNRRVDALLDSSTASFDPVKARTYASRAYQMIVDDAPAVFLYDVVQIAASHPRIEIPPFRLDGWWMNIDQWSIPPNKRIDRDRIGLTQAKP